jgi:hypothetical protein
MVTDFNTGTITLSLNHTLQISLYYSTHKDFSSLPDFQLSTELSRLLHQLPTANSGTLNPVLCCSCQLSRCHHLSVNLDFLFSTELSRLLHQLPTANSGTSIQFSAAAASSLVAISSQLTSTSYSQLNSPDSSISCQLPTPELSIQFSAAAASYLVAITSQLTSTSYSQLNWIVISPEPPSHLARTNWIPGWRPFHTNLLVFCHHNPTVNWTLNFYSGSTIPAFRLHVTIFINLKSSTILWMIFQLVDGATCNRRHFLNLILMYVSSYQKYHCKWQCAKLRNGRNNAVNFKMVGW